MLFAILELTDVLPSIGPCIGALSVWFSILELTDVLVAIGPCVGTLTICLPIFEFTDVYVSIGCCPGALTMGQIIFCFPGIVFPYHDKYPNVIDIYLLLLVLCDCPSAGLPDDVTAHSERIIG